MRPSLNSSARTKIVATLGPASRGFDGVMKLVLAGVDVFRLNMAHGTEKDHDQSLADIRAVSAQTGSPVAVLVDLAGPKIRLGELPGGEITCVAGTTVRFVRGMTSESEQQLVANYDQLVDDLEEGDRILLADATVELVVEKVSADFADCEVVQGGTIRDRQGINLPGTKINLPALGAADLRAAAWAAAAGVDFVGLSFVRQSDEIVELKQLLRDAGSNAHVIAKIEKPQALDNLESIVAAADGVMIARGDLGVEIDIAAVPLAQKRIIQTCQQLSRPVVIATQMLASMERSRYPTRAEVTDVANAVLDGGDACMLSGETAIGKYPIESVQMMNRIALVTESQFRGGTEPVGADTTYVNQITQAVVYGAARIARQLDAPLLVVATRSGATALALSQQRLFSPALALSEHEETLRKMCLYWGMYPVREAPVSDPLALKTFVDEWCQSDGCLKPGDRVVVVAGTGVFEGTHNSVEVHEVEDSVISDR